MHLPQRSLAAFLYPSFISFVSAFESQFPIWFFFFLKRKKRKKKERKLQWSTGLSDLDRITFLTPPKKKKKKYNHFGKSILCTPPPNFVLLLFKRGNDTLTLVYFFLIHFYVSKCEQFYIGY